MKPLKERLPLIDAAIDGLKEWPDDNIHKEKLFGHLETTRYKVLSVNNQDLIFDDCFFYICTRDEFNERKADWYKLYDWAESTLLTEKAPSFADFVRHEMTTGNCRRIAERHGFDWQDTLEKRTETKEQPMKYEYGVEYETNGEKPDLPDDVEVVVMFDGEWQDYGYDHNAVENWSWGLSEKFRIVDERYKPKEQDMNNDWCEKGELPPVGEAVNLYHNDAHQGVAELVEVRGDSCAWWNHEGWHQVGDVGEYRAEPIRTETDELVEQLANDLRRVNSLNSNTVAKALFEQGYRKIKSMSKEEFIAQICIAFNVDDEFCGELYDAGCRFLDKVE